ncbi:MAG TPA: response regulator, partial [Polyangiaceae bacterium]|nr:response regulator [Polyangiaceae bacterium]
DGIWVYLRQMAKKALIIDVEPTLTDLLGLFLRRYGFEVIATHDGLVGFERITVEKPDLVVMDVLLPRIRGHELCWRMKQDPSLATIPVIVMSSIYEGYAYMDQAQKAGADAFMLKPIEPRAFVEKVAKLVGPLPRPTQHDKPLHHQLWDIRQRYEKELPHKIAQIEAGYRKAVGDANRRLLAEVHMATHSVVGTAGSLGLHDYTALAKPFELHVVRAMGADGPFTQEEEREGIELLYALRALFSGEVQHVSQAPAPAPAPKIDVSSAPPPSSSLITPRAKTVAVIEHDAELAQNLHRVLSQFGYAPRVFPMTIDAIPMVANEDVKALVVDMSMPIRRGGGVEFVTELRNATNRVPPVVFLAPKEDWDTRARAVRAGGDAFIVKPVDTDRLIDALGGLTTCNDAGPNRTLIIADVARTADHLAHVLRTEGMLAQGITNPSHTLCAIAALLPDVIVVDIRGDQQAAVEMVQVLRQHHHYSHIPFVMLSLAPAFQAQVRLVGWGPDDFVDRAKGSEYVAAVVQARSRRARLLQAFTLRDALTGLPSHLRMMEELRRSVVQASRERQELCYAYADLDFTGKINDEYGIAAGDQMIRDFGALLRERLRRTDIVGRLGSDGFGILLPNTKAWAAARVLDEIRMAFGARHFRGTTGFIPSVSVGVAEYPRCEDAGSLHSAVERALFAAKESGRNRVEIGTC